MAREGDFRKAGEALLELLVTRGLAIPEDAARALSRIAAGGDPVTTVLEEGLAGEEELATLLENTIREAKEGDPARDLPGPAPRAELSDDLASLRRLVARAQGPAGGGERAPLARAGQPPAESEIGAIDPWLSALASRAASGQGGRGGSGKRQRFTVGEYLREEAGREVHEATDADLGRPVELHLAPAGSPPDALAAVTTLHAELAGPAVPVLHNAGLSPEGRPYMVLSAPPGPAFEERLASLGTSAASAAERRELLSLLPRVARALDRAHEKGALHGEIGPHTIWAGRHGQVLITGFGGRGTGFGRDQVHVFADPNAEPRTPEGALRRISRRSGIPTSATLTSRPSSG